MSYEPDNRAKKIAGRKKRRRFLQGKRSYLHAMVNSIAKRAQTKKRKR
jgi:hypothetical protein